MKDITKLFAGTCMVVGMLLIAGCVANEGTVVNDIEITGFGIFDYERLRMDVDENSSIGAKLGAAKGLRLRSQTTRVPIRPGLAYGVRFVVHGSPPDAMVDIKVVLKSTAACVLRATGQVVHHNDSILKVRIGEPRHIGARFPTSAKENHCVGEAQPGTYAFELYHGDRKLAEKAFRVIKE